MRFDPSQDYTSSYPTPTNEVVGDVKGYTNDIVAAILAHHNRYWMQGAELAKRLRGNTPEESCSNIHAFIRSRIRYILDPENRQFIESPARTLAKGFGDCKAYSLLAASLLTNMGLECSIRFVSYERGSQIPTHVYVVGAGKFVIDACLPDFNDEKKYSFKMDKPTRIMSIAGIGASDNTYNFHQSLSEGEMSLQIQRERAKILLDLAEKRGLAGIGNDANEVYQQLDQAIHAYDAIKGIGKQKKPKGKVATFIQNAAQATAKAITAPQRLAVKGVLEVMLPGAAPAFLYLFLPNDAKMTEKVTRKRNKMVKLKNFIVSVIGMKEAHFMGIVRNGILKKTGKQPEQVLVDMTQGAKVSGIGFIDVAIDILFKLIGKIFEIFKKKPDLDLGKGDAPDTSDFASLTATEKSETANSLNKSVERMAQSSSDSSAGGGASDSAGDSGSGKKPEDSASTGKDNSMLWLFGAAAASFFLLKK